MSEKENERDAFPQETSANRLFKCKICGATVVLNHESIVRCRKCGMEQPVPDYYSEHVSFLYGRANHYFRTRRFEKALQLFEQIASEAPNDCEACRSIVLCRYGVSYEVDKGVYSREPRIHRVRSEPVMEDHNYLKAISLADEQRRAFYREEAERIERNNQEIVELAQEVSSFDAVITFRAHDAKNRHTPEKAYAEELYHLLEESGFRVYDRHITASGLAGSNYDACLYKALYTARIMFVFASKSEYLNDTSVIKEWSIFLERMRNKEKKVLVICLSEEFGGEIPDELSRNNLYTFTDISFMREMIEMTDQVVNGTLYLQAGGIASDNEESISEQISGIFQLIENGEFSEAENRCHTFLSSYPDHAPAYLGLLMCDLKVRRREELSQCKEPFVKNRNYRKILLLDKDLSEELQKDIDMINERMIRGIYARKYDYAMGLYLNGQQNKESLIKAKNAFDLMNGYQDSQMLSEKCGLMIAELEYRDTQTKVRELLDRAQRFCENAERLEQYHLAKHAFDDLEEAEELCRGLMDCEDLIVRCQELRRKYQPMLEELKLTDNDAYRRRRRREQKRAKIKEFFTRERLAGTKEEP